VPAKQPRKRASAPEARRLEPREWLRNPATFSWDPGKDGWLPASHPDSIAAQSIAQQCHVVARAVRSAKAASGVSDVDLARELGVKENTVGRYLRGEAPIPLWSMNRMAAFLRLDITLTVSGRSAESEPMRARPSSRRD
jgi:hypothetical protein